MARLRLSFVCTSGNWRRRDQLASICFRPRPRPRPLPCRVWIPTMLCFSCLHCFSLCTSSFPVLVVGSCNGCVLVVSCFDQVIESIPFVCNSVLQCTQVEVCLLPPLRNRDFCLVSCLIDRTLAAMRRYGCSLAGLTQGKRKRFVLSVCRISRCCR
jgi:hypothetical protein